MKKILLFVRPTKVDTVKQTLSEVGHPGFTCRRVMGRGKRVAGNGNERMDLLPKRMFVIVVPDEAVDDVVQRLMDAVSEGHPGDGRIFVIPVERSYNIHLAREL